MFEERRLNFSRHPPASHQCPRQKDFPTWICLYELEYEVWPSVAAHSGPLASTGDSESHYGRSHLRGHGWPQILCLCCSLISLEWVAIPREHWVEQLGQGWEGAQSSVNLKGPCDPPASPSSSLGVEGPDICLPAALLGSAPVSCILNIWCLPSPLQPFPTLLWLPVARSRPSFFLVFPVY